MAKMLLQFDVDTSGGVQSLDALRTKLESVGLTGTQVQAAMDGQEKSLNKLLDKLEPTRVATEKLAAAQNTLAAGYATGQVGPERYAANLQTLNDNQVKAAQSSNSLADAANRVGTALAAYVSVQAVVGFLKSCTDAAIAAGEANARLQGVFQATGYSAGLTSGQVTDFAHSLLNLTGTSVATTQSAAAMLATFNVVRGDAFERTLTVSADLAAVWGTDMTSAAAALGKAMVDPTTAALGLRQAHIKLTEAQKDYIQSVTEADGVDAGRAAILDIVGSKTKDVAAQVALANGGIKLYAAQWDEAKISLGNVVLQTGLLQGAVRLLADGLAGATQNFKGITAEEANFNSGIQHLTTDELTKLISMLQAMADINTASMAGLDQEGAKYLDLYQKASAYTRELAAARAALTGQTTATQGGIDAAAAEKASAALLKAQAAADAVKADFAWLADQQDKMDNLPRPIETAETAAARLAGQMAGVAAATDESWIYAQKFNDSLAQTTDTGGIDAINAQILSITKSFNYVAAEARFVMSKGLADGILGALGGDDFTKAWQKVWEANAKMAGKMLEDVFTGLQKGKSLTGALQGAGLVGADGSVNWGGALGAVGGMVSSYGASQSGGAAQATGAIGGALTGASIGLAFAGVGAIIGAVIGGIIGYFSSGSGQKSYGYNITAGSSAAADDPGDKGYYFTAGNAGVGFNYGGPDAATMQEQASQLNDKVNQTSASFRDLLASMNQGMATPSFSATWKGSTTDAGNVMKTILDSLAPKLVLDAFKPYLVTGMESIGISAARAGAELATFDTSDFATALANYQAYIKVIVSLNTVVKDLTKPFADLQASLTLTVHDTFLKAVGDAITQIGVLSQGLDSLSTPEQVARATDIVTQANAAINAIDQYITLLAQAQAQYNTQYSSQTTGWAEQVAKEKGPDAQVSFYEDQLTSLQNQLKGAGSVEIAQQIWAQIQTYTNALWQMNRPAGMYSDTRTDAQNYLDAAKKTMDTLFSGWNDEAQKQRDGVLAALAGIQDALTSASGALAGDGTTPGTGTAPVTGGGCFPGGVMVLTPAGGAAIETLTEGDEVLSFSPDGRVHVSVVEKTFTHTNHPTVVVEYWGGKLRTTRNHWVLLARNSFKPVGDLTIADTLVDGMGNFRPVLSVNEAEAETVYNIEVSVNHTFFADGIRVHNVVNKQSLVGSANAAADSALAMADAADSARLALLALADAAAAAGGFASAASLGRTA